MDPFLFTVVQCWIVPSLIEKQVKKKEIKRFFGRLYESLQIVLLENVLNCWLHGGETP